MNGYPKTTAASFDPDPSWDVSPIAPFDKGSFNEIGDADGSWSPWFGHGRVDAPKAVAEARRLPGPVASRIKRTSQAQRQISDNNPAGIQDVLHVDTAAQVQDVRITLDISHSWIGDLRVSLTSPDGTTVLLHDRAGGNRDNIRATFDNANLPALSSFKNRTVIGDWALNVQDLASGDTGALNQWELDLGVSAEAISVEDAQSIRITDNDPNGIVRLLQIPAGKTIQDLAVSVDITHAWIGDLRVSLKAPNGSTVVLHNQTGDDADNLLRTWRTTDLPGLQALRGSDAGGRWELQVADLAAQDEGKLNRWQLEITG